MTFNRNAIPVLALVASAGLVFTACEREGADATDQSTVDQAKNAASDLADSAEGAADRVMDAAARARTEFVDASTTQINAMERQIEEFVAAAREKMPSGGGNEINRVRDELNNQLAKAKVELQKVQNASGDAWRDVSGSFTEAFAELQRSFTQVKEQFSASMPKLPGT